MSKHPSLFLATCLAFSNLGSIRADVPAVSPAANIPAAPASATVPFTLTEAETAAGWRLLFDGKSLAGWRSQKSETPPAGWQAADGALTRIDKGGDILTTEEFGDFELVLDWKIVAAGNSGIFYRVGLSESRIFHTGPECQVLDNIAAKDRFKPSRRAASLYDLVAPPADHTHPVGEWNTVRILIQGWRIEHWLNGVKVVETDLASPEGKALIAGSKFNTMAKFATLTRGHIAFQDHGDLVSFRNIRIRELK